MISRAERDDLPLVADAFALGRVRSVAFLPSGLMNLNWRVEGACSTAAVKRLLDPKAEAPTRSLALMGYLAAADIPVPVPLTTTTGQAVVEIDGRAYCGLPWVEGQHPAGAELTVAQARSLGAVLGRIHLALGPAAAKAGLGAPGRAADLEIRDPAAAAGEADRFLALIASLPRPDHFDLDVVPTLHRRRVLLEQYQGQRPPVGSRPGPAGWTHGDFQPLNVVWRDGQVAAVLDWDRVRVQLLGEEVVRSATLLFATADGTGLDLERIAAFTAGYRTQVPLTQAASDDAAQRTWWNRMTDLWILKFRYDRADSSCDHLYGPSCAVLEWWTTRRGEVREAFAAGAPARHLAAPGHASAPAS
ncbi:MAG: phosphotransferase [Actinomycetota bacterium]|nr:phosphotransferase [Actinomycetota bacterium]